MKVTSLLYKNWWSLKCKHQRDQNRTFRQRTKRRRSAGSSARLHKEMALKGGWHLYLNQVRVLLFVGRAAEHFIWITLTLCSMKMITIDDCTSSPVTPLTSALSPGFQQYGGLPGQLIGSIHLIAPVHAAAHHSRQPQGLNFLHGAGERDRPLAPPLSRPAQVASAPLSAHLNSSSSSSPATCLQIRSNVSALCLHMCCSVMFDVAFNNKKVREL